MAEGDAYEVRRLDEFVPIRVEDPGITWRPVRRTLGIRAFGINAYTAAEGEWVVEEHREDALQHEEVYVVVSGRARFTLGDEEVDADAGTLVYVRDPGARRGAVALTDATIVLAVGGKPGEAYQPSAWEWWFAASPAHDRGDYAAALAIVEDGLAERPDSPGLNYAAAGNLARLGRRADALRHLRRAVELDPTRPREWARESEDFADLRTDPEFLAITGQPDAGGGRA